MFIELEQILYKIQIRFLLKYNFNYYDWYYFGLVS